MPLLSPAAFLAVLAATVPAFAQTTWHVDASAAPPGDGTQAHPYASIAYAVQRPTTVNGDRILVNMVQHRFDDRRVKLQGREWNRTGILHLRKG